MNRKLIPSIVFVLLMISSPAAADLFVTPYGSFNYFKDFSTRTTLEINTPTFSESVEASQLDNAVGGGIVIGTSSESSGLVLGLNVEYIGGKTDHTYTAPDGTILGDRSIESPAIGLGGFIGAIIPGLSNDKFQSVTGIEVGALIPMGSITLTYEEEIIVPGENGQPDETKIVTREEKQDFDKTSLYVSFFFTEDYAFGDTFGLSGTLGWRSVKTKAQTIETASMSGGYIQEYSGFFLRLGLKVDF